MGKCKPQELEETISIDSLAEELENANVEIKKIEIDHVTENDKKIGRHFK